MDNKDRELTTDHVERLPESMTEKEKIAQVQADLKSDLDIDEIDYSGAVKKRDAVEDALVKKLDWIIIPTLWLMYWLNYLDRNAIATARLNDLEEDLGLDEVQYVY